MKKWIAWAKLLTKAVVYNTIETGCEAPRRWYGTIVHGKPFWRYLKRKHK